MKKVHQNDAKKDAINKYILDGKELFSRAIRSALQGADEGKNT
jgi:hypothetical protein